MWLMLRSEIERINAIMQRVKVDAATIEAYESQVKQQAPIVDDKIVINIEGVLTKTGDPLLDWFGIKNTAYSYIEQEIESAEKRGVAKIQFKIDSGGGTIDGLYSLMNVIEQTETPTEALITGMAASAAYMLASQTDKIIAENPLSIVGSVGVVTSVASFPWIKEITNRQSANKRPDVETREGVEAIQNELDDIYSIVVEKIAAGRGVTVEAVNENYGKGAIMTARTALVSGMIDAIGQESKIKTAGITANKTGEIKMDRTKLKAEFPELFAAIKAEGAEEERKQVLETISAHVELHAISGDTDRVLADIKELNEPTASVMTYHLGAGQKRASIEAHQEEQPPVVDGGDGTGTPGAESIERELQALAANLDGVEIEV